MSHTPAPAAVAGNYCPECGRAPRRYAFPTTTAYAACLLGHVFPLAVEVAR